MGKLCPLLCLGGECGCPQIQEGSSGETGRSAAAGIAGGTPRGIAELHTSGNTRVLSVSLTKDPGASLVAQTVKNQPAMQETWVPSLSWEDPLEEGMATNSSVLAWKMPWTEEPGGLQSIVS